MKKQSILLAIALPLLIFSCKKDEGLSDEEKSKFIKVYGTQSEGVDIVQTADEGFILLGTTQGESSKDIYLKCVDKYGHHVWSKTYDGPIGGTEEFAYDLELLADGGFAISGTTVVFDDSTGVIPIRSTYLILTDYLGKVRWDTAFNFGRSEPIKHEEGFGLTVTSTGDIFVASRSEYVTIDEEVLFIGALRKIEAGSRNVTTYETILGTTGSGANIGLRDVIMINGETEILVTGDVDVVQGTALGDNLCYAIYDAGNFLQTDYQILGGPEDDLGYKIMETAEGDVLISGFISAGGERDMGLIKITGIANPSPIPTAWKMPTLLALNDECKAVVDQSDGYVLVGYTERSGDRQMIITKISKNLGSVLWTKEYGYVDHDEALSAISTIDKGLAIIGTSSDERGNRIMTLLKLDSQGNLK